MTNNVKNYFERPESDNDNKFVLNGSMSASGFVEYTDNAGAISGGLEVGDLYINATSKAITIVV